MNAIAAPKSSTLNWFEGMTLTAIFQGVPTFAIAVLALKLTGSREIVTQPGGAAIFVVTAALAFALLARYLGPRFPRFVKNGYDPLFFDATLSFNEKIVRWRARPMTSVQLMSTVMVMSLLAVAVVSVR